MIMIILLKILSKKSSAPIPWKNSLPPKKSKSASPPLFANTQNFSEPALAQKGGPLCCVSHFFFCNRPCSFYILPHENKIALGSFYHKKLFLIENEYKTPFGCLALIFCQKYLLGFLSKIISETLHAPNKTFLQLQETKRNTLCNFSLLWDKINLWVTMQNATKSHKKFS